MNLKIFNNYLDVTGNIQALTDFRNTYSYRDKSAESQIKRFHDRCAFKERMGKVPDWWGEWKEKKLLELADNLTVFACNFNKDSSLHVPIGLKEEFKQFIIKRKIKYIEDQIADLEILPERMDGHLFHQLRKPQAIALQIVKNLPEDNGMGLIKIATGVGKTTLGQEIINYYKTKSLFVVPSLPILNQTFKRFSAAFGYKAVGMYGNQKKKHRLITIATYQGIYASSPGEFDEYELALFDEVHHIAADTFYDVALNRLPNLKRRYGLTADEERADGGTVLVHAAVGPLLYSYEASEGIRDGYLATPTFIIYEVSRTSGQFIDWKTNKDTGKRINMGINESEAYLGNDYLKAYKNWVLGNDEFNDKIALLTNAFNASGKSVLILVSEREHGDKFRPLLNEAGFVYGGMNTNEENQELFNARGLKTLVATSTLGEGADTVPVDILINLKGGTRPKQANGRALRNDPDENGIARKPTTIIIDFDFPMSPVLHRHSLLRQEVHKEYVGKIHEVRKLI